MAKWFLNYSKRKNIGEIKIKIEAVEKRRHLFFDVTMYFKGALRECGMGMKMKISLQYTRNPQN